MTHAPIILFVYNRPDHTKRAIEALQANEGARTSDLYIFSDAPKNHEATDAVNAVRAYIRTIRGFQNITIVERERNWGLADSIVDGVTHVINQYGSAIILEDDILTSPYFLRYMNDALTLYKDEDQVMHVSGYFYPVDTEDLPDTFFYNQTSCWGWGTWARAWKFYRSDAASLLADIRASGRLRAFDMDGQFRFSSTLRANIAGRQKTWAVKWYASVFLKNGLCLHPHTSLTKNIGNDGSGTNAHTESSFIVDTFSAKGLEVVNIPLQESVQARNRAIHALKKSKPSFFKRIRNILKIVFN